MNEEFFQQLKAQSDFYFQQGVFSKWIWRCKRCGNTQASTDLKKKPAFCECKHCDFEPPFLRKIERPPLEYYPELKQILENPLPAILEELSKHVAGEMESMKTIFLVSCMAKVSNANSTSGNLMINSVSGSGKDFVVDAVIGLWDSNYSITRSRISPTALNYWHQEEPEWNWVGKILFLADISNGILNADSFKAMASGQNSITITEKGKALDISIPGKPVLLLTSAFPNPNQELLRRFPILSLNETTSQTKQILRFHGKRAANKTIGGYNQNLRLALDFLQEYPVIVPYAESIAELFPDSLPARTYFGRLIDFIKASTVLHQIKREQQNINGIIHLVAQREDYELGATCFLSTALTSSLTPLTSEQRKILQWFSENKEDSFSFNDLREKSLFAGIAERTFRRQLEKLAGMSLIQIKTEKIENSIRPVQFFSFKSFSAITLPNWEEVQNAWQNRQNGITDTMAEQAELAEREKSKDLTQSAKSAQFANENALSNSQNATQNSEKCELCQQPAEQCFWWAGQWLCQTCALKEREKAFAQKPTTKSGEGVQDA